MTIKNTLMPFRLLAMAAIGLAAVGITTASGSVRSTSGTAATKTLVIDHSFDLKSSDPAHSGEPTGELIGKPLYESLFTFNGGNVAKPIPLIASSYTVSKDARTYTIKLKKNVRFNSGARLTSADVVFSFNRVINIKAIAAFFLDGVSVSAKGPYTVILKTKTPNPALPYILPNAALGIVEAKVVRAHGGTDRPGADKTDKAEAYLNTHSAGTGPYMLKSFDVASQVVMVKNPRYWGKKKAGFDSVVVRNVTAPTQMLNVQRGKYEIALDLSPTQASTMHSSKINITRTASANVVFLFANRSSSISSTTPNAHFQNAIRYALDYPGIVRLAGQGALQAGGIVPSMFLGALPRKQIVTRNIVKAKSELAASGISNPSVKLEFPSDVTLNGLSFATLAQKVQSDLAQAGIKVTLAGTPIATALGAYRGGQEEIGLWYWSPDFPDPNDYIAFLPGEVVGKRAGWLAGADPTIDNLRKTASASASPAARTKAFQAIQRRMNTSGPFFPLIQPGQVVVASKGLTGTTYNPVWYVDIAAVRSR